MKLQSKKARIPIAALGVTALVAGMGALASPAFAVGETLAFGPTATSATIVNTDPVNSAPLSALTYGTKVTGMTGGDPLRVSVVSGPTGGAVYEQRVATNGTPVVAATTADALSAGTIVGATTVPVVTGGSFAVGDTIKIAGATSATDEWREVTAIAVNDLTVDALASVHPIAAVVTIHGATAFKPVPVGQTAVASAYASGDNLYLGATMPGTYTVRVFQDRNGDRAYSALQDDGSPLLSLIVKDVTAATLTTTDDLSFGLTAPATAFVGDTVTGTATPSLTLTDTRGTSAGKGILGSAIGALTYLTITPNTTGAGTGGVSTFTGTAFTVTSTITTTADTMSFQPSLDLATDYVPTAQAVATVVGSNNVDTVDLAATEVDGQISDDGAGAVSIKTGRAAVTYTATVEDTTGPITGPVSGAVVNFTVSGDATNIAKLSFSGTLVDDSSTTSKVYSAMSNSSGVASLTVTSSDPDAADTYDVDATTNSEPGTPTLTALYADLAAAAVENTNTAAELTPTVAAGMTVTLKGRILDQFEALYTPTGSQSSQAQVYLGTAGVLCAAAPVTAAVTTIASATANAPISAGIFSHVYTPATTPTAGHCQKFALVYDINGNGTVNTGEFVIGTIQYASTTAAASVSLTSPNATVAGAELSDHSVINPGQSVLNTGSTGGVDTDDFGDTSGQVTGVVYDAANVPLAFKSVVLTGGAGVYFSTVASPTTSAADDLATTITVVTNASGVFGGGYAFFTKSGTAEVTATVGTVSDMASVTTDDSSDPYFVTVNDVSGAPGSTLIVTGTVKDAFLNMVPGAAVNLSIGTSTLGAFGDSTPTTNAAGVFSTTFTSGSNSSGTADLEATLWGQTANRTADADWLDNAGLTIAHGEWMDTATLTISSTSLTLVATDKVTSGPYWAKSLLSGTFLPNTSIDIYSKPSGSTVYSFIDTAMTDAEGEWGSAQYIKKSTYFLVRSSGLSSLSDQTKVYSKVALITAKALGGGNVKLYANGDRNAKAPLVFYRSVSGVDPKLKGVITGKYGSATVYVKLPKGTRYVYATYQASGQGKGISKRVQVVVK